MTTWQTTRFEIDLRSPKIMGIVNLTPDSFSDGGRHDEDATGAAYCERLVKEGAHILDIGGESSRPGAPSLAAKDEWLRIASVLRVALTLGVPVSIDTCKPEVMQRALDLGADIINDIRALQSVEAETTVLTHGRCGVCLMHMQGDPADMQIQPSYPDVVAEVVGFLGQRAEHLVSKGLDARQITLDPGIGFGKTPEHNLMLLKQQARLLELGWPVLVGWSRKSTLGHVTGRAIQDRLVASVTAALASIQRGAHIVRVHDVAATVDALAMWEAAGLPESSGQMNQ
jgi:dihydropteroate synthase